MRILAAHPDPVVRASVAEWLAPFGHAVDQARDINAARAAIHAASYEVVLMAMDLVRRDDSRLLKDIKRGRDGHSTAVILIDRNLGLDEATGELGQAAHDFLLEPLNPAELFARVQAARRMVDLQGELLVQSRRMEALVHQDALTGVNNRRFLFAQLGALLSGARRHERSVSVVLIDLDHFKVLNDNHGHAVGDRALVEVAQALRSRLRAEDTVGRLGGEEFLAILPDTGDGQAEAVAESLRACIGELEIPTHDGDLVNVTASVGWATWRGESPEDLVRRADRALYAAKAAGRDLVRGG